MENKKKILTDTLLGKIEDVRKAVSPLQELSKNIDGTDYVDVLTKGCSSTNVS